MAVQADTPAESWSCYLYRAARAATPATIAGFTISANPAGAVVSGATALALFFAFGDCEITKVRWKLTALLTAYMINPAVSSVVFGRYSCDNPDHSVRRIPVEEFLVDVLTSGSTYLTYMSTEPIILQQRAENVLIRYLTATAASCSLAPLIRSFYRSLLG